VTEEKLIIMYCATKDYKGRLSIKLHLTFDIYYLLIYLSRYLNQESRINFNQESRINFNQESRINFNQESRINFNQESRINFNQDLIGFRVKLLPVSVCLTIQR